jgi:ABC-type transport system involved in multi-copper enzyme maturation permease subunit
MAAWPLIVRELRELSRQGQLFWIRVIAAAIAFGTTAFLLLDRTFVGREVGIYIFDALNRILFFTIIAIGPLITADCVAREKREGTLGLLLLSPLTSRDIILSKLAMNSLRAFTLLLAVIPLMALPIVFGGVPPGYILHWTFRHLLGLSIALSSGLIASTLYREFIQAAVVAEICCLTLLFISGTFSIIGHLGPLVGILLVMVSINFCSAILKERWEKDSAGYEQPFWIRIFSESQAWHDIFRWDTQKARSRHPIAWLQEYSWSARLAKWGWCAFVVVAQFVVLVIGLASNKTFHTAQLLLATVVVLGLALSGANSFRTERLTGAMELLLVTPLSPMKIIGGRLWGMWVHFFPAIMILVFLWIASAPLIRSKPGEAYLALSSYIFLPMIGLFISMLPWNVLVAAAVIFVLGAVAPIYVGNALALLSDQSNLTVIIALQALLGFTALTLLYQRLRSRAFVLS